MRAQLTETLGQIEFRNRILARLSSEDLKLLEPNLEKIDLPLHAQIDRAHQAVRYVYFIEDGVASVVANGPLEKSIEVGLIGREGFTGLPAVFGAGSAPHEIYMQVGGSAWRIETAALRKLLGESQTLLDTLLLYAHCFFVQTAQTALVNGRTKLEDRLARWLLMEHDRIGVDEFPVTHEFLATMLGVRRPGVTVAINELQKRGLIKTNRGSIEVVDRKGLVEASNGAYGVPEAEYQRVLG